MYPKTVEVQMTEMNATAQQLLGANRCFHVTCRNHGEIAGVFRTMDHKVFHTDLKEPRSKAEVFNFHAAAGDVLQAGDDLAFQYMLEPRGAHDDERGERHHQDRLHQEECEAYRFGNLPARMQPALF